MSSKSSAGSKLPSNPRQLFKFRLKEWFLYNGLIAFFRATGLWKYPIRAAGDIEKMRFLDKLYWLYKASYPIQHARKNSGLEEHFAAQARHRWELPPGFVVEGELSLSSVGDLINHVYLKNSKESLFAQVSDLVFGADLAMANLECPIFEKAKGDFVFNTQAAPPLYYDLESFETVKGYKGRKFHFMATACNHSLDFGIEGIESTIRTLDTEGIAYNGMNATDEASSRATILEQKGFRLGLVAYTFGLNAYKAPKERPRAVNHLPLNDGPAAIDFTQIQSQIAYCREQGVDFVIFHLHWGFEHELYPVPEQVELAHRLAEMGVDAIIGHHPHVVQPFEYYRTQRDPARVVPIFYSLGNLVNYFTAPYLRRSAVAQLRLVKGRVGDSPSRVYVKEARQLYVFQEIDNSRGAIYLVPDDERPKRA